MFCRKELTSLHPTRFARQATRLGSLTRGKAQVPGQCIVARALSTTAHQTSLHPQRTALRRHSSLVSIRHHSTGYARSISKIAQRLPEHDGQSMHRFREFELNGRVFVVTGGARGLGLTLAEALVEAGGDVYCLDRLPKPADDFYEAQDRVDSYGGSLHYRQVDVQEAFNLDEVVSSIAGENGRMDGLVAAAGIQYVCPALEYPPEKVSEMMNINFRGVYLSAVSCARQMLKYNTPGSIVLVGSMSGLIANKGLRSSVYNSSKAAVIQLSRSLAMEWGQICNGRAIRVNALCPGNILTPMVEKNFVDEPHLKSLWESENMMGRLSKPHEYRGAVLFMLSDASSFMTGSHLIIDGGYTAW